MTWCILSSNKVSSPYEFQYAGLSYLILRMNWDRVNNCRLSLWSYSLNSLNAEVIWHAVLSHCRTFQFQHWKYCKCSYLHNIIYKNIIFKKYLKKFLPCSADCQLQPPACQQIVSCSLQSVKNLEDSQLILLLNITDLLLKLSVTAFQPAKNLEDPHLILLLNITDLLCKLSVTASSVSRIWKIPIRSSC